MYTITRSACGELTLFTSSICFYTGNIEQLTGIRLQLIDLEGNVIQRPVDITNTEFTATGRLEVLYSGHWGTVCSDRFTDISRDVACKQLGYERCWIQNY